jgi:hypothetical protein
MGRTNPTYRDIITSLRDQWQSFKRGLRREDQDHFEDMFDHAENYADAAGHQNSTDPMDAVILSILLEHEKRLTQHENDHQS